MAIHEEFVIAATSSRSIARSVVQAGYRCEAFDRFADWDTRQICPVTKARSLDEVLSQSIHLANGRPLILGGGFEHASSEIDSGLATICGATADALQSARDPEFISHALLSRKIESLNVTHHWPGVDGRWIRKPYRSGGGIGVRPVSNSDKQRDGERSQWYQEYVEGEVYGASFIAHPSGAVLIGVCKQSTISFPGSPFAYQGSIGPLQLEPDCRQKVQMIGDIISRECRLQGWFGIDLVVNSAGVWCLEVNPRYTASMEILERAFDRSLFGWHLQAISGKPIAEEEFSATLATQPDYVIEKRYLFNLTGNACRVTPALFHLLVSLHQADPVRVTDIPHADSVIGIGEPICTVWAQANESTETSAQIERVANEIYLSLVETSGGCFIPQNGRFD